jgi:hypothetical protein
MSLARDAVEALRNFVLIQERLRMLTELVRDLNDTCDDLRGRVARLEGKFELLERMGAPRTKRLP